MFKIGLKLWSTNTDHYLREAKRLYEDGIFDYIELYCVPNTINKLNAWSKLHDLLGIPFIIHNAHYQHGFNLADKQLRKENLLLAAQSFFYADKLEAKNVIFHCGTNGDISESVEQLRLLKDSRILIENKPYQAVRNNGNLCRGYSPDEIHFVVEKTKCGFCLDISHGICAANSLNIDPIIFLKSFILLKPSMFHLCDNHFFSPIDAHMHLSKGDYPLQEILKLLPPNSSISIETKKDFKTSISDFKKDCEVLRAIS